MSNAVPLKRQVEAVHNSLKVAIDAQQLVVVRVELSDFKPASSPSWLLHVAWLMDITNAMLVLQPVARAEQQTPELHGML